MKYCLWKNLRRDLSGINEDLKDEVSKVKKSIKNELEVLCKAIYANTDGIIKDLKKMFPVMQSIQKLLNTVNEEYMNKKKESGTIDFSDCEHLALKALEDEEIRKTIKLKYDEIYIDEYQDTSLIQEEILNCVSKENNKIMVGDVKQSIYGFRHARPDIFMQKFAKIKDFENCDESEKEVKIILSQNFRSRKEVIESINYIFQKTMSYDIGGTDYLESEKLLYGNVYDLNQDEKEVDKQKYKTEINIIEKPDKEQDQKNKKEDEMENDYETIEETEGSEVIEEYNYKNNPLEELKNLSIESGFVADKIKELVSGGFEIFDKTLGKNRKCEYKDIVILMRSTSNNTHLIEEVFKDKKIPVYSDTASGFYKADEINLIISILMSINNPYNDIPLISAMYSIFGDFKLDELVMIRKDNKNGYFMDAIDKYIQEETNKKETNQQELLNKLVSFKKTLEKYRLGLNIYNLSETVNKVYQETGIYNLMKLENNGKFKCANLDAFLEIVKDYENKDKRPLCTFLKYIESVKKKESAGDSPKLLGENENVVRIMTIHKSKGLEFPVVILMNAAKKYNEEDLKKEVLKDSGLGIGINILNEEYMISYPAQVKQMIKFKIKQDMLSEELRLLYTALTRARDKLLVYGTVSKYDKIKEKLTISSGFHEVEDRIPLQYIKNANNYLNLILMAVFKDNKQNIIELNVIKSEEYIKENVNTNYEIEKKEKQRGLKRDQTFIENLLHIVEKNKIKTDTKYMDFLKKEYTKEYKYESSTNIEQKYTATELKHKISGENMQKIGVENLLELKPNVLNVTVSNMTYGTFIHKVLENIDFQNISEEKIKQEILDQKSVAEGLDNIDDQRVITSILKLFKSDFKHMVREALEINKEYEFVIQDKLSEIEEIKFEEETLIQGVIDLYLVTNSNTHVIIDFKTDHLTEEELINRYKYQLYIYKRAIQIIKEIEAVEMYIYSFNLGKLIQVK